MSVILDILIKSQEFNKINIEECLVEWGEEKLSQDPKKYHYNSKLIFHENTDLNYYAGLVKNILNVEEFMALTLEDGIVEKLDRLVYTGEHNIYTNELIYFINEMYIHLNVFCLIKFRNEECIDEVHIVDSASKAITIFVDSLKRDSPKGVVIIKK